MKKLLARGLTVVIALMLILSGCTGTGGGATPTPTTASPATAAAASTASAAPTVEPVSPETEADRYFGKYDEPVTVRLAVPENPATVSQFPEGDSYGENIWTRSWLEEMNIKAEVIWGATDDGEGGQYDTKLSLAIASRDLPDIINFTDYTLFESVRKAGLLADLSTAYEDYVYPLVKTNLNADGGTALSWGTVDGQLMGLPREGVNRTTERMMYLRHDWFEATGLPEPKTLEEYIDIAKAMKDADPDKRFAIPFFRKVIGDTFCDIVGVANAFGAYPRIWVDDGQGGLQYGTIQPEMLSALQMYADLYKGGYIDPAFASIDGNKVGEQLTSSTIGAIIGASWIPSWPLDSLWESEGIDWDIYPLLPSATLGHDPKPQATEPRGAMFAVLADYEHPEVLMKLFNFAIAKLYDPERAESVKFHTDPDDPDQRPIHMYTPLLIQWGDPMTNFNTQVNVTNVFEKNDTSYLKTPHDENTYATLKLYFDKVAAGEKPNGREWASYKTWIGPQSAYAYLNSYINEDRITVSGLVGYQTPTMVKQWGNLIDLDEQYIMEIVAGTRPIEAFQEFIDTWNAMGGADITKEVNEWYSAKK